jgi:hypothetical protein
MGRTGEARGGTGTWRSSARAACGALCASLVVSSARADPLRLRGDALLASQGTSSPTGLVVLQGQDAFAPWVDAEALVWAGAKPSAGGDVLSLSVHLREPHGYAEIRAGRFVLATGAVHPVQIDGAHATLRTPWGTTFESFGGVPVVPAFGPRAYDWIAGGRIAQRIVSTVALGVSYEQRREDGDLSDDEVGVDLTAAPARWIDLGGFASYDLANPGIAEARGSAATRFGDWRVEIFGSDLSPGRLLPATSLFSVLGDLPSQTVGATVRWAAAPRLDLLASGAGQDVAGGLGGNGWVRASLRLDDRGDGSCGLELRRMSVPGAQWSGVRAVAALPIGRALRYSNEVEIVVPDQPDGRGAAWPWGLSALSWRSGAGWNVAAAIEASSSPLHRYEADALLRLSYAFEEGVSKKTPTGTAAVPR